MEYVHDFMQDFSLPPVHPPPFFKIHLNIYIYFRFEWNLVLAERNIETVFVDQI